MGVEEDIRKKEDMSTEAVSGVERYSVIRP
jgi:hypothetical protein